MNLSILYRGPLASCNYDCGYCPFAKRIDPRQVLRDDRNHLGRFVDWAHHESQRRIGVLFTPWGEALIRKWYQDAIVRLSNMAHVTRVAIQTNLSCRLTWLESCDLDRVGLWCTWHPSQTSIARFLDKCRSLDAMQVRYSVGVVGLREHFEDIQRLRELLNPEVYLWINAYKREADYYEAADIERLASVDPLFEINNRRHASLGRACHAGHSVIAVDGDGDVRRCHFIPQVIGNLYDSDFDECLKPRPCTGHNCGCHIGYVHLEELDLYTIFGAGVLERIPARPVVREDARSRLTAAAASPLVQVSITG